MKRPKWKWKRPAWHNLALAVLCLAVLAFAISSIGGSSSSSAASRQTATVARGVVQSTVSGSGSLEPARQVELSFGASGEVTAIEVEAGQRVSKNQVLARIDASSAEASLAQAEAQLTEAVETLESAAESSEEVAWESDSSTSTSTLVAYVSAAEGAEGEGEEDTEAPAEDEEEEADEGGSEKKSSGNEKSGTNEKSSGGSEGGNEAGGGEEAAPTEESSGSGGAETSGSGGGGISVAAAEAQLLEAELNVKSAEQEVSETILRAPIAGTVSSISGAVGETVSGGSSSSSGGGMEQSGSSSSSSAFVVLSQLGRMKLQVSFSEADINEVEVGQAATVTVSSLEEAELAGEVTHVDLLPTEGSSSVVEYSATILLTQTETGLRAGMSATAEVVVEEVGNAIAVPSEAISGAGQNKSVTVEGEDGGEVRRTVTTGLTGDETTQVISGVERGETLILPEVTVATGGGSSDGESSEGGGFGGFSGGPPSGGGFSGGPPSGGGPGGGG